MLRVGGRAQSVPARRPQFFTGVLRSQRQSCHKLVVAFRALYRRALAPAKPQLIEWAFGKMASRPAPRRMLCRETSPEALGTATRGNCRRGGEKCRLGAKCPAYDSTGRIWRRTRPNPTPDGPAAAAKPRRFAQAHTGTKKAARPAPEGPNRDRCCPAQRARIHASTAAAATRAAITITQKRAAWLPQDLDARTTPTPEDARATRWRRQHTRKRRRHVRKRR